MNNKLLNIQIKDDDSLLHVCDILHDSCCDISTLKHNQDNGQWTILFKREYLDEPSKIKVKKKLLFIYKYTYPLTESILKFNNLNSYEIEDKSGIGIYMFNECKIRNNRYEFIFCENMKMTFTFDGNPSGELQDLRFLDKTKTITTFGRYFDKKIADNEKMQTDPA